MTITPDNQREAEQLLELLVDKKAIEEFDGPKFIELTAEFLQSAQDAAKPPLPDAQSLWLWQINNGVFVAYDNPYPCKSIGGDPLIIGEPDATAIFKKSVDGCSHAPRRSPPNSTVSGTPAAATGARLQGQNSTEREATPCGEIPNE